MTFFFTINFTYIFLRNVEKMTVFRVRVYRHVLQIAIECVKNVNGIMRTVRVALDSLEYFPCLVLP